jgi:hypothetical protein
MAVVCELAAWTASQEETVDLPAGAVNCSRRRTLIALAAHLAAVAVLTAALAWLSASLAIPPIIEADYAYTFTAADRFYEGHGLTATPPRAPLVPWEWRADWVFLTQWPAGYPLLLAVVRALLRTSTAEAGVALAVLSCAVAVVGWFAWARRALPGGMVATLLAAVVGIASFSPAHLVNPSTDALFVALTPLVLLAALGIRSARGALFVGIFAGATCWIRYAAIALPGAIGLFLLVEAGLLRRRRWRFVAAFACGAAIPIIALLVMNRALAGDTPVQEQLNLGRTLSFALDPGAVATAWRHFARQTLYAHRPEAGLFFLAGLPLLALLAPAARRPSRRELCGFCQHPATILSAALVLTTLGFLVAASVFFAGKYNYVGQPRYYASIRPLYFVLFVGPFFAWRHKAIRVAFATAILAAGIWFIQQDHARTLRRWAAAASEATDYGRAARRFAPHSQEVFAWLKEQAGDDLVVFSNFHEEIVLETHIPACPTPRDPQQLATWQQRIAERRGVWPKRILFVLDPDNDYRSYYLPPPAEIVAQFGLTTPEGLPEVLAPYVFTPQPLRLASTPSAAQAQ